jgi:hypothetical protein
MAYLDLFPVCSAPVFGHRQVLALRAAFDARERAVIELARSDPLSSLSRPGFWSGVVQALVGIRRTNRLADPQLEALRRMAVLLSHGRESPAEQRRFLAAGYSAAQCAVLAMELHP